VPRFLGLSVFICVYLWLKSFPTESFRLRRGVPSRTAENQWGKARGKIGRAKTVSSVESKPVTAAEITFMLIDREGQ